MRNWAGNIEFSTADLRRPRTVEELQQVVADAPRVRALGTGHSFNAVADTPGTLVSTQELDLSIEVAAEGGGDVAVVPGGATYAEVAAALHEQGRALHNLGSLPHISVAGACATGTHGSGVDNGTLATAVVGLELVRADGEIVELHESDPDFAGAVVSLGALGVVTRLWLRTEPTYDVAQDVLLDVPTATVSAHVEEVLASAYSVSVFSTFDRPDVIDSVWRKHRLDPGSAEAAGGSGPEGGARPRRTSDWGGRRATEDVHPIPGLDPRATTEQRGVPAPWHHRLPHFRIGFVPSAGEELQSEFFLDRVHAGAALEALGAHAAGFAHALLVFEMRTIAADDLWLSPFRGRDTVAVHATWVSDIETVAPALAYLEGVLAPFDPRPHWGKVSIGFDRDRLADLVPALPRFRALAERYDPQRCFVNDHLVGLGVR